MNTKTRAHQRYRLRPTNKFKDGEIVPGVTTIIDVLNKPALLPWANKLGLQGIEVRKYVDDKADIGTLAHAMIINELLHKLTDTSDYSKNQIDAAENAALSFYEWLKKHCLDVIYAEIPVVSEKYKFGGQWDICGLVDKKKELIDLKTGSGIYEEHYYQIGGYLILSEDCHDNEKEYHIKPDQVRILNIPRSEDENFSEVILSGKMMDLSKEMFLDCLSIYNRKKEIARLMKRS